MRKELESLLVHDDGDDDDAVRDHGQLYDVVVVAVAAAAATLSSSNPLEEETDVVFYGLVLARSRHASDEPGRKKCEVCRRWLFWRDERSGGFGWDFQ
jgi:hypothetical protein